jgi:hypothetical protein
MLVDYLPNRRSPKREGAFQISPDITLYGGLSNIVDDRLWEAAMMNPIAKRIVEHMIDVEGSIRIIKTESPIAFLTALDETTAIKKVFDTVNAETLSAWKGEENRKAVSEEIQYQLDDLSQPGKVSVDERDRRRRKTLQSVGKK